LTLAHQWRDGEALRFSHSARLSGRCTGGDGGGGSGLSSPSDLSSAVLRDFGYARVRVRVAASGRRVPPTPSPSPPSSCF